jgi:hypothetical protein
MKGKFIITCYNTDLSQNDTEGISVAATPSEIENALARACPSLRDKILIEDTEREFMWYGDGRDFLIKFKSVKTNLPQFTLRGDPLDPPR